MGLHDDEPPRGWCVQIVLVSDHAIAMRMASVVETELGEPTTAVCVDGARWPVVIVETTDEPAIVTAAASLCRAIDRTARIAHCSGSQPWSMRTQPAGPTVVDFPQPA